MLAVCSRRRACSRLWQKVTSKKGAWQSGEASPRVGLGVMQGGEDTAYRAEELFWPAVRRRSQLGPASQPVTG